MAIRSKLISMAAAIARSRDAQLPRLKTLEEFDFAQAQQISAVCIREVAEGGYIERNLRLY